jgi:hypothetical protein
MVASYSPNHLVLQETLVAFYYYTKRSPPHIQNIKKGREPNITLKIPRSTGIVEFRRSETLSN